MKMTKPIRFILIFIMVIPVITGCAPVDSPADNNEITPSNPAATATVTIEESIPAGSDTLEMPPLSDQVYTIASGAFSIQLPSGWNCSESGAFQVDCQSPDGKAEMRARITSTTYELTDDSFEAFAHAELVSRYADVKAYKETDRIESGGRIVSKASWRVGGDAWASTDTFIRNSYAIMHISTNTVASENEKYAALFDQVAASVEVYPDKLPADAFYPFTKTYTARESFFKIAVPTSWSKFTSAVYIDDTLVTVEGFLSPDIKASVQVAIYQQGTNINLEAKGLKTREIKFELYGFDLKNLEYRVLPDDRTEQTLWYAAKKDIYGISNSDSYSNTLYVLSIVWEPSSEMLYRPVLEEIMDSFSRE